MFYYVVTTPTSFQNIQFLTSGMQLKSGSIRGKLDGIEKIFKMESVSKISNNNNS